MIRHWPTVALATLMAASLAACSDRVSPVPNEIARVGVNVPPSATNFYHHETGGLPFVMVQYRFDFAARELPILVKRLPCTLGPVETGPPGVATVGANDRDWYIPESAERHRGCEARKDIWAFEVLIDVARAERYTAYIVLSD